MSEYPHTVKDDRITAVCLAASNMKAKGYSVLIGDGAFEFADEEIEKITYDIEKRLSLLGPFGLMPNLFGQLKREYKFEFDMFLTSRRVSQLPNARLPSIPFGFLYNLASKIRPIAKVPENAAEIYVESIDLARDLVACLNIEPYSAWTYFFPDPSNIEKQFRELAIFDHLFIFRQWRFEFIEYFIDNFFEETHNKVLKERLGWNLHDLKLLLHATDPFTRSDGNLITRGAIITAGAPRSILNLLLQFFAHINGQVNLGYKSPLSAQACDLMFKPFVKYGADHIWVSPRSLIGPAVYEVVMAAIKPLLSKKEAANLPGAGTERVCAALFRRAGLNVTHVGARYDMGGADVGECDLIIESDSDIILIERKAKAPTRAAMSGRQGEALIDFCAGVFIPFPVD